MGVSVRGAKRALPLLGRARPVVNASRVEIDVPSLGFHGGEEVGVVAAHTAP